MNTLLRCRRCEQSFQIPLHALGKSVRCPYCSEVQAATTVIATGEDEFYRPSRSDEPLDQSEAPATQPMPAAEPPAPPAARPVATIAGEKVAVPRVARAPSRTRKGSTSHPLPRPRRRLEAILAIILCVLCVLVYSTQSKLDALFRPPPAPDWAADMVELKWDRPAELLEGAHLAFAGKELLLEQGSEVRGIGFASADTLFVAYNREGKGRLVRWNCKTGERQTCVTTDEIARMAVAEKGGAAAVVRNDGRVHLVLGPKVQLLATKTVARGVAISPSFEHLAVIGDKTLEVWDVRRNRRLWSLQVKLPEFREWGVPTATFSADGKTLAVPWRGRRICLFDVASSRRINVLHGENAPVCAVAFSPNGQWLISGDDVGNLTLFMGRNWKLRQPISQQNVPVSEIVIAPDNRTAAVAYLNGEIDWVDLVTGERLARFLVGYQRIAGLAFSPSGRMFAAANSDRRVQTWRTEPLMQRKGGR